MKQNTKTPRNPRKRVLKQNPNNGEFADQVEAWNQSLIGRQQKLNSFMESYLLYLRKNAPSSLDTPSTAEALSSELLEMASLTMSIVVLLRTSIYSSVQLPLTSEEISDGELVRKGKRVYPVTWNYSLR